MRFVGRTQRASTLLREAFKSAPPHQNPQALQKAAALNPRTAACYYLVLPVRSAPRHPALISFHLHRTACVGRLSGEKLCCPGITAAQLPVIMHGHISQVTSLAYKIGYLQNIGASVWKNQLFHGTHSFHLNKYNIINSDHTSQYEMYRKASKFINSPLCGIYPNRVPVARKSLWILSAVLSKAACSHVRYNQRLFYIPFSLLSAQLPLTGPQGWR